MIIALDGNGETGENRHQEFSIPGRVAMIQHYYYIRRCIEES